MKLFNRYNRANLMVMTIVFILSGIVYYLLISRIFIHELDEELDDYQARFHAYVQRHDTLPDFENFDEITVVYQPAEHPAENKFSSVKRVDPEDGKKRVFRQLSFTEDIKGIGYAFKISKPVEGTKFITKMIALSTMVLLLLIIVLSVLLNRLILKKLWRPFYATVQELSNFRLGKDHLPVFPESGTDEFSFLNQSLTDVIGSAADDYRILKEFTENAAHELQTPLAIIRSKLDLVIQEEGLSESQEAALKSAYKNIHRLSRLNQSLLLLTKIENKQFSSTERINMKERLEEKMNQFSEFWSGQGIQLLAELEDASVEANTELIDILLNNLLANAGRHNIKNGTIFILLRQGSLKVTNTGIARQLDPQKLFSRFYKEAAYSQSNGLGLSIIKQIAEGSGFEIRYQYKDSSHAFILSWHN